GIRVTPGPGVLSALATTVLVASAWTSSPDLLSTVSVMSVRIRPNDDALVIRRVTPPAVIVHRYSAWVCAETITLIDGSSRLAISAMALPARLPAHPLSAAVVWEPASWITR